MSRPSAPPGQVQPPRGRAAERSGGERLGGQIAPLTLDGANGIQAARFSKEGGARFFPGRPRQSRRFVVKRTFQPHRKSRLRTHGFRKRMKTPAGREILRRRRRKGRKQLTVSIAKK